MPGKASLIMKYMLQHQRWSDLYTIELKDLRAEDKMVQDTVNKQLNLIDRYVLHRTTDHGSLLACIHVFITPTIEMVWSVGEKLCLKLFPHETCYT